MWAIPTGTSLSLKKKIPVKSPSPEFRVLEIGSDPPIGSDRDSGCDKFPDNYMLNSNEITLFRFN